MNYHFKVRYKQLQIDALYSVGFPLTACEIIRKYFYNDKLYKKIIKKKKNLRIINEYKKIKKYKKMIKFVYQNSPKGTGDAVLKAKKLIKDNYFLMLLPDDLIIKKLIY